ncbi:MAG: roadblock/LC7 domain-containing protein [Desulfomonile tiedjei]|uniref:Roadblock/LC7 domain-containing protein n=1 Tax=Desulfomonile tiedjei TaxID=2358 RepID=A0A9D6Z629_9BACT|nr:roadblock/LC7 domain-containing protein [Desulfomonile tiedjei]
MGYPMEQRDCDFSRILQQMIDKTNALTALLVTKEGISVAEAGDTSYLNTTAMSALVAGMFSATREVARMVGETQFSILLQQGENRHIHIGLIADSKMLVIIFEDFSRIGLVRYEARRICPQLEEAFRREASSDSREAKIGTPLFKEYALNLIDRIFETK